MSNTAAQPAPPGPAPPSADAPGSGLAETPPVQEWSFDVSHRHARLGVVIDTYITLWRRDHLSAVKPRWVIEKRLRELGGSTLAALAVADERNAVQVLARLELPCAKLVEWQGELGGCDPYALYTEYVGPSLEEVLRHPLPESDYKLLLAAVLEAAARYADARVLPVDFKIDNVGCGLTDGLQGHLDLRQVRLFDHRHTVVGGKARSRPWPFIGLPEGSPPEVVLLLQEDTRRDLREQAPGCPVRSFEQLRRLSVEHQTFWMTQLKSPALGGALDDGSLNLHGALQCMLANSLLALLRRHETPGAQVLPSRRLHPDALAFVQALRPVLLKMNSARAAERFDTLMLAAAAVRAGVAPQHTSSGILRLRHPGSTAMEGASQPFTEPAAGFSTDVPALPGTPSTWARWTQAGRNHGLATAALRRTRWSAALAGALLTAPLLMGWVRTDGQARIPRLLLEAPQLPGAQNLAPVEEATLQRWMEGFRQTRDPGLREQADELLERYCNRLARRLAADLTGRPLYPPEVRAAALRERQRMAGQGVGACARPGQAAGRPATKS